MDASVEITNKNMPRVRKASSQWHRRDSSQKRRKGASYKSSRVHLLLLYLSLSLFLFVQRRDQVKQNNIQKKSFRFATRQRNNSRFKKYTLKKRIGDRLKIERDIDRQKLRSETSPRTLHRDPLRLKNKTKE